MLKEYGRVRVRATGMYGHIVDWAPGASHCEVELDGWQHEGQIDGDRQFPYAFSVTELEEVVEVGAADRKSVLDSFDTMVISSFCFMNFCSSPTVVIKRSEDGVRSIVHSWDFETNEDKILEGETAARVVSAAFGTHADKWTKPFEPHYRVTDGYSWTMHVYSGNRYFMCSGDNAAPAELVDLLCALAEAGLPPTWNEQKIQL